MATCPHCDGTLPEVPDGTLVTLTTEGPFTLAPGHPMRGTACLVCRRAIGGEVAAVIGLAALSGEACRSGCVAAEAYLLHSHCFPADPAGQTAVFLQGIVCQDRHQWAQ